MSSIHLINTSQWGYIWGICAGLDRESDLTLVGDFNRFCMPIFVFSDQRIIPLHQLNDKGNYEG